MLSIHRHLREATADAHRDLEDSLSLVGPGVTTGGYIRYLRGMYGFHVPVEAHLLAEPCIHQACSDIEERARVHQLRQDLQVLSAFTPTPPLADPLPSMQTLQQMLGVAYVLEGSTLGGQVLRRELEQRLKLPPQALTYVTGYGADTGRRFRTFMHAVDRACPTEAQRQSVIESAIQTFTLLKHWLTRAT